MHLAHRLAAIGLGCACAAPPGAELVAHLLARAAPRHLAPSLLRAAGELARAAAPAPVLAAALARCLLLDVRLWARAPLPTQRVLVQTMLAHAKARAAAARSASPKPNPKRLRCRPRPQACMLAAATAARLRIRGWDRVPCACELHKEAHNACLLAGPPFAAAGAAPR
jgi:hypothetical protein